MTRIWPATAGGGIWELLASGLGYHLDNLARWLVARRPQWARTYAALIAPRRPRLAARPNWQFAEEYYSQRRWLACRRGAVWEAAAERKVTVPLTLPWHGRTVVDVTLGNDNSLCLYVCGSFEPNEFFYLDGILGQGMVFLDVGANDGYFTLFAARKVGPAGRVIAVEPSSRERNNLQRNIANNGLTNVTIVPLALGAAPGSARLRLATGAHSGHNTLGSFAHASVRMGSLEDVTVDVLDEVVRRLGLTRIDFIKIDVEGAEGSVIGGARKVLLEMRPTLLLEINDAALTAQGCNSERLVATLRDEFNYEILVFSRDTGLLEPRAHNGVLSPNIVACPREGGNIWRTGLQHLASGARLDAQKGLV